MDKKITTIFLVIFIVFAILSFQYIETLKLEIAKAYDATKPLNGHSWSEMQCTSELCVKNNNVGIGMDNPMVKLDIAGDVNAVNINSSGTIMATTDVCNGSGACLSDINDFVQNQPLVNNVHNYAACTAAGGEIVPGDASYPMCRFNASSCPSGWTQYNEYCTATQATCDGTDCSGCCGNCSGYCVGSSCTTGASHSWGKGNLSCTYTYFHSWSYPCVKNVGSATCYGTITQIGCY